MGAAEEFWYYWTHDDDGNLCCDLRYLVDELEKESEDE